MNYRDLLESGANVSVTVKLDDLKAIFKEVAGAGQTRATARQPPCIVEHTAAPRLEELMESPVVARRHTLGVPIANHARMPAVDSHSTANVVRFFVKMAEWG